MRLSRRRFSRTIARRNAILKWTLGNLGLSADIVLGTLVIIGRVLILSRAANTHGIPGGACKRHCNEQHLLQGNMDF